MKPTIEELISGVWTVITILFIIILFSFTATAFLLLSIYDSFSVDQITYLLMSFVLAGIIDILRGDF